MNIDTTIPEVKETIEKIKSETGFSEEQILSIFEQSRKRYVRFTKGKFKGQVGYYYYIPIPTNSLEESMAINIFPYSHEVYLADGEHMVLTMGWTYSFEHIAEEEYLKECEVSADD